MCEKRRGGDWLLLSTASSTHSICRERAKQRCQIDGLIFALFQYTQSGKHTQSTSPSHTHTHTLIIHTQSTFIFAFSFSQSIHLPVSQSIALLTILLGNIIKLSNNSIRLSINSTVHREISSIFTFKWSTFAMFIKKLISIDWYINLIRFNSPQFIRIV